MAQEPLELSLETARKMAVENSEDLRKSGNNVLSSKLDYEIARNSMLPTIDASGTLLYMSDQSMGDMGDLLLRGTYNAGLSLTQPIYVGGKINNGRKLAQVGMQASEAQDILARQELTAQVDNAYWTYLAVERKVQMVDIYQKQLEAIYRKTQRAVDNGMAVNADLLTVKTHLSNIEYQKKKAQSGLQLCRMALCRIIGADMNTEIVAVDSVINVTIPDLADTVNISQRPEMKLLDIQVDAAKLQMKMNDADRLPVVALSLGYNLYGNIKMAGVTLLSDGTPYNYEQKYDGDVFMAVLTAQIPLWHWGKGSKTHKKSKIAIENAELEKAKTEKLLTLQAEQALSNYSDAYYLVSSAEDALKSAEENLKSMTNRYNSQLVTLTDLLQVQAQWQQASSNYIEAQTQFMIYQTEYLKATGQL